VTHPSDAEIRQWLDTGAPSEFGEHVGTCDQCTAVADRLSGASPTERIRTFLAAPAGFEDRIAWRVDMALSRWEAVEALAGMFSVGVQTAGLMIGDVPDE